MRFRDYKIFRIGCYYHIFNRGNNKQAIFLDSMDYMALLKRLKIVLGLYIDTQLRVHPLPKNSFSVISYCLMPNHFHFLIRQNTDVGIEKLIQKVITSYVMYFNRKYNRVGGLFQDAFKAKLVDNDRYAQYISAYIHNNPYNLDYDFSSYKDIVGLRNGQIADKNILLGWFNNNVEDYKKFVQGFSRKDKQQIIELLFEDEDDV